LLEFLSRWLEAAEATPLRQSATY